MCACRSRGLGSTLRLCKRPLLSDACRDTSPPMISSQHPQKKGCHSLGDLVRGFVCVRVGEKSMAVALESLVLLSRL